MAKRKSIKVWYDPEADFLEVIFSKKAGFMRETNNSEVMERVGKNGEILGFSIIGASKHKKKNPLIAELA